MDYISDLNFVFGAFAGVGVLYVLNIIFQFLKIIIPFFEQHNRIVFLLIYAIFLIVIPKIIDLKEFRAGFLSGYIAYFLVPLVYWILELL